MSFLDKRNKIVTALNQTGIIAKNIVFSKDIIPREFPAAILILDGEKGKKATSRRYLETEYNLIVYLIADVNNSTDPDSVILQLANSFKEQYKTVTGSDIPKIDYYPAKADSGRKVRIAKVYTVAE